MSKEKLIYREVPFYTQTKMMELLKDKNIKKDDILDIILCVSMNEISFKFAEKVCKKFIKSEDSDIKGLVIIAVGHIARVYGKLVDIKIINELIKVYDEKHPKLGNSAEIAFDDIENFLNIDFFKYKLISKK